MQPPAEWATALAGGRAGGRARWAAQGCAVSFGPGQSFQLGKSITYLPKFVEDVLSAGWY